MQSKSGARTRRALTKVELSLSSGRNVEYAHTLTAHVYLFSHVYTNTKINVYDATW